MSPPYCRSRRTWPPAGYEGLLLDGVALASEQMGVLNPAAGTGAVANSGTPIYQGLVANLEYAW